MVLVCLLVSSTAATFRNFIPISEVSWDDGKGGISRIMNLSLGAKVLKESVYSQGFTDNDFSLFIATGTSDKAYPYVKKQVTALLKYKDTFQEGRNTFYYLYSKGTHSFTYAQQYIYDALQQYFSGIKTI